MENNSKKLQNADHTEDSSLIEKKKALKKLENRFFGTIIFLAIITIIISLLPTNKIKEKEAKEIVSQGKEYGEKLIQQIIIKTNKEQSLLLQANEVLIEKALQNVQKVLVKGVPHYLDWHYSVAGEYSRLFTKLIGYLQNSDKSYDLEMDNFLTKKNRLKLDNISKELNFGINKNIESAITNIKKYAESLDLISDSSMKEKMLKDLNNIQSRLISFTGLDATKVGVKIGALVTVKIMVKVLAKFTAKMMTKLIAKSFPKFILKFISKSGVAGLITLLGSATLTPFIGIPLGIATWIGVDYLFISIDEYFNREELEAEMILIINNSKDNLQKEIVKKINDPLNKLFGVFHKSYKGKSPAELILER
jgi:hypothetical protein